MEIQDGRHSIKIGLSNKQNVLLKPHYNQSILLKISTPTILILMFFCLVKLNGIVNSQNPIWPIVGLYIENEKLKLKSVFILLFDMG